MTGQRDFSLIVAFGTDMGNAEDAAMTFAEAVAAIGIEAEAIELNQVELAELQSATHFVVVCSTFGEGEFPDNAVLFWEALSAETDRLEHLSFAVLALGDSSYEFFCNAGKLLDERLEALGATRLVDRVDVDGSTSNPPRRGPPMSSSCCRHSSTDRRACRHRRRDARRSRRAVEPGAPSPVEARLVVNRLLTAPESDREVRHYEVDLTGPKSTIAQAIPSPCTPPTIPLLVDAILAAIRRRPRPRGGRPRRAARRAAHRAPRDPYALASTAGAGGRGQDAEPRRARRRPVATLVVVVRQGRPRPGPSWPTSRSTKSWTRCGPLQFRDYSIASSPLVHPEHVHLTVATVRYAAGDRHHGGVASTFLAERGETVRVHLRPNHTFRLPAADVPIIMIGPGTGIAPFRAFLQERRATRRTGRSWLFFGDRRRATDFLYGDELQDFVDSGTLTRLDLAFSRDQTDGTETVCAATHVGELGRALRLAAGRRPLYVCGDEKRMAKDVDAALRDIVARGAGWTPRPPTPTSTT